MILGVVLAIAGAGGGYFTVSAGLLGGEKVASAPDESLAPTGEAAPLPVFVALDPLVISLPGPNGRGHLKFTAQLEVSPAAQEEVQALKPRIIDVLNGYLRAVEVSQLEDPAALARMRAQMLRRAQVAAGEGRVKDLLIMEFVLS